MKKNYFLIAALVSVGMMTSCSSSTDSEETSKTAEPANVYLKLATGSLTRATGSLSDGGGTIGTGEGTVNLYTVGLFDNGNVKVTISDESNPQTTAKSISTTTQSQNVVVAANTYQAGLFTAVTNATGFNAITTDLKYTTSTDGQSSTAETTVSSQQMTALPMYGTGTLKYQTADPTQADVSVALDRIVARVSISKLETAFTGTSYDGAIFIPNEIFMYNVNDGSTIDGTTQTTSMTEGTTGACEITTGTAPTLTQPSSITNTHAYLSSGLLSSYTATGDKTYWDSNSKPYFFYVFPHNATSPTKLVIKGIFFKNSSDTNGEIVYYPIIINHAQSNTTFNTTTNTGDDILRKNTSYDLSVTIKGKGMANPSLNIVPATANVSLTVNAWTKITQEVVVN